MGMTLTLSEEDTEAVRAQASAEGRSMHLVVQSAVREYIARHSATEDVDEALHVLIARYSRLLERLGNA